MSVLAAVLAGLAALVAVRPPGSRLLSRRLAGRPGSAPGPPAAQLALPPAALAVALVGAGAVGSLLVGPAGLLAVVAGCAVPWWHRHRRGAAARGRSEAVAQACQALAGELRTGSTPTRALTTVGRDWPELLGSVAARAGLGGDVPTALREAAGTPGAEALDAVAAAWDTCERTGAGLADVLHRVADGLRAEASVRREAQSHLAPVRATARMLAVMPVLVLLVLSGGGGRPLQFLTGTPWGLACLAAGLLLAVGGVLWVERLARGATPGT